MYFSFLKDNLPVIVAGSFFVVSLATPSFATIFTNEHTSPCINSTVLVDFSGNGTFTNICHQTSGDLTVNEFIGVGLNVGAGLDHGTLTVNGGSQLNIAGQGVLAVGQLASGELAISGGGGIATVRTAIGNTQHGEATISGTGSRLTVTQDFQVGAVATGIATISNGGRVESSVGVIGNHAGSDGSVTIDGADSKWITNNAINVGFAGTGDFSVLDGAKVTSERGLVGVLTNGVGAVRVSGPGSSWIAGDDFSLAYDGRGAMTIEDGGSVTSRQINIGSSAGSSGQLDVSGAGSLYQLEGLSPTGNRAYFTVGRGGAGVANITEGGQVVLDSPLSVSNASSGVTIGREAGGSGILTIDGAGSALTVKSDNALQRIGRAGDATLNITNGGAFIVEDQALSRFIVTRDVGSTANVLVDGESSRLETGKLLTIGAGFEFGDDAPSGPGGNGTVSVRNGATLTAGDVLIGDTGTLTADAVHVGGSAPGTAGLAEAFIGKGGAGILTVNGTVNGAVNIGAAGTLGGSGTVNGTLTNNGGKIGPGNSPGLLTVSEDFVFGAGLIEIEIGGLGSGEFDLIHVLGDSFLTGGEIRFTFIDDFLPSAGDMLDFMLIAGGLTFENVSYSVAGLAAGFQFAVDVVPGAETALRFSALTSGSAIAEPATFALFVFGLAGLGYAARRRLNEI